MAKVYVKDIHPNDRVESIFKVAKKALPTGKSGKPFLTLTLFDKTGDIDARVWENAAELDKTFEVNDLVQVAASTVVHQGRPQLKIDTLSKAELGELTEEDFGNPPTREEPAAPAPGGVVERRYAEVLSLLERVNDPHVRALLKSFAEDPELAPLIKRAPAAKTIHHAYPGGLLEHTLSCMKLAHRLADHYPMADRDLLIAGAFLHDVMKVKELAFERGTEYTDEGRLVGHLVMTAQQIHQRARAIEGFPELLEWHLTHIVLAHHGSLEYGSPKVPATLEALLVHELDELDSRVSSWLGLMQRDGGDNWTQFDKLYERHIWKGPAPTAGGKRPVESRKKRHKAPTAHASEGGRPEGRTERPDRPERPPREHREPREPRPPREHREGREPRPAREGRGPKPEVKLTFKPFAAIAAGEEQSEPSQETPPAAAQPAPEPPAESAAAPEAPSSSTESTETGAS